MAYNFFTLKKEIQDLLKTFGIKNYEFILNTDNTFFNENSLMIKNNHSKEIIGSFGEINNNSHPNSCTDLVYWLINFFEPIKEIS